MNDRLIFCGLVSIPTGIVISLSTPIGIMGALAFTGGAALGSLIGRHLGREFVFRYLPFNDGLQQITALALVYLANISGGWALANFCGFAISFKVLY